MKLSLSLLRLTFALILGSLLHLQDLSAQHNWQHTEICEDCVPQISYFGDSLVGYVQVSRSNIFDGNRHFFTTDGGVSWVESEALAAFRRHHKQIYHDVSIDSLANVYISEPDAASGLLSVFDLGSRGDYHSLSYYPFEIHMSDSENGRMIGGRSAIAEGTNITTTFNGGDNWYSLYEDRLVTGYNVSDARLIEQGAIVSYELDDTIIFERTLDSAKTWSSDTIHLAPLTYEGPLNLGFADARYLQVVQGKNTIDYIATEDGGKTWMQYNIADGRVHRIYEPSENKLWAIVGRTFIPTLPHLPSQLGQKNGHLYMADTLYYSTNAGASWEKDLTFANDTIADMHWPDANHGFLVSYRDNKVKVSRLAAPLEVKREVAVMELRVWPNPSKDRAFTFTAPQAGEYSLEITDISGRMILSDNISLQDREVHSILLDSELSAGVYILNLKSEGSSATAKLLLE